MNTVDSLRLVLQTIEHNENPAFMLCTGDLANDPAPEAYAKLHRMVGADGCPIYCLPGNHDDPEMARNAGHSRLRWDETVEAGNWLIIMLDSHVPGRIDGRLPKSELNRLEQTLARHPDRHTLICLHHHPVAMQSRWLDNHILKNADEFFAIIDRHPQVRGIVWGHVHQAWAGRRNGVELIGTPSTCFQFQPRTDDFAFDERPPAYRRFRLHANGNFTSEPIFCEPTP